jgi:molecular chaperone DnaK (HSP70)
VSGLSRTAEGIQAIRKAVIQAKWDLSERDDTDLFGKRITRAEFDQLIRPIIDRTLEPCRQALADAELDPSQIDEVVLVGGSTRIPLVRRLVAELFGKTPHSELNPDEVVALGAAVQADNRSLAQFKLRGIPPMPAGMARVQVHFQIDSNGILSVSAHELRTDIEQTIEVKPSYGLTDEEVERMLLDSFENAEADFAARLLIEARNEAETVVQATEKTLRMSDFSDIARTELKGDELDRIKAALADLKSVLGSADRESIQEKTHTLNDATRHLAEVVMNRSVQAALAGKNIDQV